jgi:plastocyanin
MRRSALLLCLAVAAAAAPPAHAQRLLERTPSMPNGVSALPGMLEASMTHRFSGDEGVSGVRAVSTFDLALGLPFLLPLRWTAGVRFAPATAHGDGDEWEGYERIGLLRQAAGAPLDVNVTGAWNFRAQSIDAELSVARRLGGAVGGLRIIAAGRAFSSTYTHDDARFAVAAGFAWQPAPRHMPLTLAADVAALTDRRDGEDVAWSAGVQTGLPYTTLSLSLHATSAATTTLQGSSLGTRRTRWGIELNAPVEFSGFALGIFAGREQARRAVSGGVDDVAVHRVSMRGYLYAPATLRVRAGDVVEWVNDDAVVHTVTAETGGFDSRGIQPGARWRARFAERGVYAYYCSPHPFMKAVVVVR